MLTTWNLLHTNYYYEGNLSFEMQNKGFGRVISEIYQSKLMYSKNCIFIFNISVIFTTLFWVWKVKTWLMIIVYGYGLLMHKIINENKEI